MKPLFPLVTLGHSTAILLSISILSACAVGPDYQRPQIATPEKFTQLSTDANRKSATAPVDWLHWWKSFNDPALNQLLDEAAANSQDLQLAIARLDEARLNADITRLNRYPTIDGNANAGRSRISQTTGRTPPGILPINNNFLLSANLAYETDFWGKFSRATEAARARFLTQEATLGVVQTNLYANVTQAYFALRNFDAQVDLARATQVTRARTVDLQQKRFAAGVIGEQDLQQAKAELASVEVTLTQAQQNQALALSTLALLLGRSPTAIMNPNIPRGLSIQELYTQLVPAADLPSDLLNRRPDILAAEQTLIATNAEIGQAKAQYFPSIKLTGSGGYESRVLSDLIQPSSAIWNLGANLTQPIFRWGVIGALVEGAQARKQQALAQYVQTVQTAFREVHDALVNMQADEQVVTFSDQRLSATQATLRLATLRYENGYSSYLEVLNAQRDLLQIQANLLETQRARLAATVTLYKSLGGGWNPSPTLLTDSISSSKVHRAGVD